MQFDTNDRKFKKIAGVIEKIKCAACAVFDEKLVVSGGKNNNHILLLNTVEHYESHRRYGMDHNSEHEEKKVRTLVVRNKLTVIRSGSNACEVYTVKTNKFPALTYNSSLEVAGRIFVFQNNKVYVWVYDVIDGDDWTKEDCDVAKYIVSFSCAELPFY